MNSLNFETMITCHGGKSIWTYVAFQSFYCGARPVRALAFWTLYM